jgi:hypothetical protein
MTGDCENAATGTDASRHARNIAPFEMTILVPLFWFCFLKIGQANLSARI